MWPCHVSGSWWELGSPKVKPSSTMRNEGTGGAGWVGAQGRRSRGLLGEAAPSFSLLLHPRERRQGVGGANGKARARDPGRGIGLAVDV